LAAAGVLALIGGAQHAQAYTVTVGGIAALDGSGLTTAIGSATVLTFNSLSAPKFGSFSYAGVDFSGDGGVVMASSSGQYAAPANDMTNYLIAGGPSSYTGTETLAISGPSSDYFGLYWGSMDAYNTLTFLNGSTVVATITGSDVAAGGNANGNQTLLGTNNYINIFDLPNYTTVALSTTQANFEVDNVAFGQVPEPGSLGLLGGGLVGLVGFGTIRRKRLL
jgi:hypothetical protein